MFRETRERAFKICAFARELKAHTHCAFPFKSTVTMKIVVERLNSLGFVQVVDFGGGGSGAGGSESAAVVFWCICQKKQFY